MMYRMLPIPRSQGGLRPLICLSQSARPGHISISLAVRRMRWTSESFTGPRFDLITKSLIVSSIITNQSAPHTIQRFLLQNSFNAPHLNVNGSHRKGPCARVRQNFCVLLSNVYTTTVARSTTWDDVLLVVGVVVVLVGTHRTPVRNSALLVP